MVFYLSRECIIFYGNNFIYSTIHLMREREMVALDYLHACENMFERYFFAIDFSAYKIYLLLNLAFFDEQFVPWTTVNSAQG